MPSDAATPGEPTAPGANPAATEQRLRRIEDALAELQNTQWLADAVAQRVSERIESKLPLNGAPQPGAPEAYPVSEPTEEARSWFVPDLVREARAIACMFVDPRYHVNPLTWVVVLVTLALIFLSHWWLGWIPIVGTYVDKAFDLIVAFIAFKALSREARRYQRFRGPQA